ncbi:hybrid sensor histidine kinase/response regulator [Novipirellula sp. SH528]|uniref:hybrid sensor histidine kinase/response regulator n=1 Tax=Novipirellula sp. SH528 TaxID=3454466 RepID=UPI003FA0AE9C
MTGSLNPQTSEYCKCENTQHARANDVPLTEERLAILGHEIRNPLSALSYALQAWPSSMDDPQLTEELLQIMRRQVSQLTRLSDDLLDTGRIARGQLSIRKAAVDISKVIHHACEEVQPFIDRCGHTMTVDLDVLPITMLGDESRLVQVLANLLHNSAKFTDRNGNLSVSIEKDNDAAVIRVCDNGRGMGADDLQNIFLANGPSEKRSVTSGDGLGIGLRLAKSIVELHGGMIEAFSEGLGHGSTFVVRLPMVAEMAADEIIPRPRLFVSDQVNRTHLPNYRVLVVDDDRSMRFLMSQLLRKIHQSVTVADNGETAIQMILQDQPEVVFLDLQMHGISGYEVARQIRSRVELKDLVLIALTGNADAASRELAAESGFDRYLVKPTSIAVLTETLLRIGEPSVC